VRRVLRGAPSLPSAHASRGEVLGQRCQAEHYRADCDVASGLRGHRHRDANGYRRAPLRGRRSGGDGAHVGGDSGGAARLLARAGHARRPGGGRPAARATVPARLLPPRDRRGAGVRGRRAVRGPMKALVALLALTLVAPAQAMRPLRKPAPGHGFQTRVDPYTIEPGQDLEVCEYRRLADKRTTYVSGFKLRMPP